MIIQVFNNNQPKPQRYSFHESNVIIGRNPSEQASVVINSQTISRNHLHAKVENSSILVMDLGSSNGTFVNDQRLEAKIWVPIDCKDKVKLAEFQGYLQIQIRDGITFNNKALTKKGHKLQRKSSSQQGNSSRSRSREKQSKAIPLPFKISESTFKMLKDMTLNKKTKQERIKFLKLMGIGKAAEYWDDIEELLKKKKGTVDSKRTSDDLERQFSLGRSGLIKRGLGC